MPIEMHLLIEGSAVEIMRELEALSVGLSSGLGVLPPVAQPNQPATADPTPAKANGAEPAPAKRAGRKAAASETAPPPSEAKIDRAGIIDGLTKIYGKGDPAVRKQITEFRDSRQAERLRDLKDEDLPAAAQLLVDLKLAEAADAP